VLRNIHNAPCAIFATFHAGLPSRSNASDLKYRMRFLFSGQTVKFKSYLLSLGIPNPVTKETHGSGTHYHMQLAHELNNLLKKPLEECGGIMLLSDAYCRVNRARGMEVGGVFEITVLKVSVYQKDSFCSKKSHTKILLEYIQYITC